MIETDWLWGLGGGLMIGMAAVLFLLVNGRIMGASGLLGGLVDRSGWDNRWERVAFLVGLVAVPGLIVAFTSGSPSTHLISNLFAVAAAGLLVGIGTRLANGCTSGHGVCGISRFSMRSIVATIIYLVAGGIAVQLFKHGLGVM